MIHRSTKGAFALAALLLAACQSYMPGAATPLPTAMDGQWASTDGVFVATFQRGGFTSRFTQTNEILAQGTYTVTGPTVSMQWMSVQAQQQRSASCTFTGADSVSCTQAGGGAFDLRRTG
jgi:hypothetical protein